VDILALKIVGAKYPFRPRLGEVKRDNIGKVIPTYHNFYL